MSRTSILGLVAAALLLRLPGITFVSHHPDEQQVVALARELVAGASCPSEMSYGTLVLHLQAAIFTLLDALGNPVTDLVAGRLLSAIASAATVATFAVLARRLAPPGASRLAHLLPPVLFAASFLSVQCAHYATVDSLMTLLATASVAATLRAADTRATSTFVAAGLFAGLATATKYTGCFAALPLALALGVPGCRRGAAVGLTFVGIGFLLGMPCAVLDPTAFVDAVRYESSHYRTGGNTVFAAGPDTPLWNLDYLTTVALGPAAMVLAVSGLFVLLRRGLTLPTALFLAAPVATALFVSAFTVRFDRNLLPLLPTLCVLAGLAADALRRLPRLAPIVYVTVAIAVAHLLVRDVVFDGQLGGPHPNERLAAWVAKQPHGTRIAVQKQDPRGLAWYQERGYRYLITSSHIGEPVRHHPDRFPELAAELAELDARAVVAITFENPWFASEFFAPHRLSNSATVNPYHGPTLQVLALPTR